MNLEAHFVGNLELLEPTREGLAPRVGVEWTLMGLCLEPLVGEFWYIAMILWADSSRGVPSSVGFPLGGPLEVLHELHDRQRADGVPGRLSHWISILVQSDHLRRRGVVASSAEADSVNLPRAGSPFVPLKLGPSAFHDCEPIAFVHVDQVVGALLDFVQVNSWSAPEDEVIVGC